VARRTQGEETDQYILILCNAIGSPVDSKYIEVEPTFIHMTDYHVIVASEELIYIWQYRTPVSKLTSDSGSASSLIRKGAPQRSAARERAAAPPSRVACGQHPQPQE